MQAALAAAGEVGTSRKALDLDFPQLGPYCLDWTRNGRYMVLGGRKGHLALMAWQQAQPFAELQVSGVICMRSHSTSHLCIMHVTHMPAEPERVSRLHPACQHLAAVLTAQLPLSSGVEH